MSPRVGGQGVEQNLALGMSDVGGDGLFDLLGVGEEVARALGWGEGPQHLAAGEFLFQVGELVV